jgi:hypothetical protein
MKQDDLYTARTSLRSAKVDTQGRSWRVDAGVSPQAEGGYLSMLPILRCCRLSVGSRTEETTQEVQRQSEEGNQGRSSRAEGTE